MSYTKQTWTDGIAGGTPINAARLNAMEAGIANADFLTCTSTTRPTTGLFAGMRIYETDTGAFGIWDAAWHMWDNIPQSFTPGFTANGGTPSAGNSTLVGQYKRMGRHCWIRVYFLAGSTINGGTTQAFFTIPSAISAAAGGGYVGEQWITAKYFSTGGGVNFQGICNVSNTTLAPYFTGSTSNAAIGPLQSCTAGGVSGTGTPTIAGNYTISTGTNIVIQGVYEMTAG